MIRRGFTLVDLMVSLCIMGILCAWLFPHLGRVRGEARRVVCLSNLRQLGTLTSAYVLENSILPPAHSDLEANEYPIWTEAAAVWHCPADRGDQDRAAPVGGLRSSYIYGPGVDICPPPFYTPQTTESRKALTVWENKRINTVLRDDDNRHKGGKTNKSQREEQSWGVLSVDVSGAVGWFDVRSFFGTENH